MFLRAVYRHLNPGKGLKTNRRDSGIWVQRDLFINDTVYFRHVPERVWRYELGGYPVIKKWLGYRDRGRRPGVNLSMQEITHLRSMVHRIAAVLRLHAHLDSLYERACLDCFSAEELGF
jgi:Type ISP C-terminal specificity domain